MPPTQPLPRSAPPVKVCLSDGNLQQLAAQPDSCPNKGHICGRGTSKALCSRCLACGLGRLAFLPAPLWEFETSAPPPNPELCLSWRTQAKRPRKSPWLPSFSTSASLLYNGDILMTLKGFFFSTENSLYPTFYAINTFPCCHISFTSIFFFFFSGVGCVIFH